MSEYSDAVSAANSAELEVFGDFITYTPADAEAFDIVAIRGVRLRDENEQLAAFERIWTTRGQFAGRQDPEEGDLATIGEASYDVHAVKPDTDPESDGITIYLNRSFPLEP